MLSYENFIKNYEMVRLFAFGLGDGWLQQVGKNRFQLFYSGKISTLEVIQKDFQKYGINSGIDYRRNTLAVYSRSLARKFYELGFPIGKKTDQEFLVPSWVFKSNIEVKRAFLQGLFGADGSVPEVRRYTAYNINYTIVKKPGLERNAKQFLSQIAQLLGEFGISTGRISSFKQKNKNVGFRLIIYSEENIIRFLKEVGYAYDVEKIEYAERAMRYLLHKHSILNKKREAIEAINSLRKQGLGAKRIYKELSTRYNISLRFIERTIYEGRTEIRIWRTDMPPFERYYF